MNLIGTAVNLKNLKALLSFNEFKKPPSEYLRHGVAQL